jgi:hypothetical protein
MLITLVISGKVSFVSETADADKESRRSARLVWTVGRENEENEVPDSTGIRRQAKNQQRLQKKVITRLG